MIGTISKFDCFLIFQMDSLALQDGQFDLPKVLEPPESNYFADVCLIFLVNEAMFHQKLTTEAEQQQVLTRTELILPKTLRETLCANNLLTAPEELPKNCLVLFDDDTSSVLKFMLGFIAFKQPNFERTQIFCRTPEDHSCLLPMFLHNRPSVQSFEFMHVLQDSDFEAILRGDSLQPRNEVESQIMREAVTRHSVTLKSQPNSLAKDLNKFTNQLSNAVNGIKSSKKFSGVQGQISESSHLTLMLFKRLLEEGYNKQPTIKDLFARNQLKSLEMLNELT